MLSRHCMAQEFYVFHIQKIVFLLGSVVVDIVIVQDYAVFTVLFMDFVNKYREVNGHLSFNSHGTMFL